MRQVPIFPEDHDQEEHVSCEEKVEEEPEDERFDLAIPLSICHRYLDVDLLALIISQHNLGVPRREASRTGLRPGKLLESLPSQP